MGGAYSLSPQISIPWQPALEVLGFTPLSIVIYKKLQLYTTKFGCSCLCHYGICLSMPCSWQLLSLQVPGCQDKKLINIIQVLSVVLTVVSSLSQVIFQLYFNWSKPVPACLASTGDILSNILYFLHTGVSYFLSYLVQIVGIFMSGNDVQMEVLPADVNLDRHSSTLICFSSWNMAFAQCLSLSLLSFFSVFLPPTLLPFLQEQQQVEMVTLATGVPSAKLLLVPVLRLESSSAAQDSSRLLSSSVARNQLRASLQLLPILWIFLIWWDHLRQPWPCHKAWISPWWIPALWASVYPCPGHRYVAIPTLC